MKLIKNNIRIIIGILIGLIISATTVYAAHAVFSSNQITYDNTTSELASTDTKGSLDELYTKASTCKKIKNNKVYFSDHPERKGDDVWTTDYTTIENNVFIAKNGDQTGVCIIRNSKLYCFDNNNYDIEKDHLKLAFGNSNCTTSATDIECRDSELYCQYTWDGYVMCDDNVKRWNCYDNEYNWTVCEGY